MEINGDVYALAVNKYELHHSLSNSLVYKTQLQRWEVVPAPMPPCCDHAYFHDTDFSLLVTGKQDLSIDAVPIYDAGQMF